MNIQLEFPISPSRSFVCFIFLKQAKIPKTFLYIYVFYFLLIWCNSRPVGQGLLIREVFRSDTTTQHSRQDSSGRVISSLQRPLPENTQHSQHTNIHAPGWDSNPQSQQTSDRRPMPQTARPPGLAYIYARLLTHCGRVTQICVLTLQLCRTGDADLRF